MIQNITAYFTENAIMFLQRESLFLSFFVFHILFSLKFSRNANVLP